MVVKTVEVEKTVIQTVEVEKQITKEVPVTPTPEGFKPSGTIRVALSNEPNSLYIPMTADVNADIAGSQLFDALVDCVSNDFAQG